MRDALRREPRSIHPGELLGRYVVLGPIASGGMADVVRAYDPKLQREVALKMVRGHNLCAEARARVVREARAMARFSHANVVAVFDVEQNVSRPGADIGVLLVMEFVAGETLAKWMRRRPRPWREVVATFMAAGRGLVAAHAEELLHRDFKPANVLVAHDGAVKVTDFGLAKPAGHKDSRQPAGSGSALSGLGHALKSLEALGTVTEHGAILGTPRYMAPEQHTGEELGPRVDQYAFCVALWEALTGKAPFRGTSLLAKKRKGPPNWPPSAVPPSVVRAIRRGLAADPEQRWPDMAALLAALAQDPRRKRRRWALGGLVITGGLAVATAAGRLTRPEPKPCSAAEGALAGAWDDARKNQVKLAMLGTSATYSAGAWTRTRMGLDAYVGAWILAHRDACEATAVRKEQSDEVMDLRMACLGRARVALEAVTTVFASADAEVVQNAHKAIDELPRISACSDLEALRAGVAAPKSEDVEAVSRIRKRLAAAKSLRTSGLYAKAQGQLERAQQELENVTYAPVRTEVALEGGRVWTRLGRYDDAEGRLRAALRLGAQSRQWPLVGQAAVELLRVVGNRQARPEEGLRYRDLAAGLADGDPEAQAKVHAAAGDALQAQGKYTDSEKEHRKALALRIGVSREDSVSVASTRGGLASALYFAGEYAEAETEYRRTLSAWEALLPAGHPAVAVARTNLANSLNAQGKHVQAEQEHRRALGTKLKALGPEHPHVASSYNNLALVLYAQGQYAEAEAENRKALRVTLGSLGPDHPNVALSRSNLAVAIAAQGRSEEAEREHRRALELRERVLGPEHPDVGMSLSNIGLALFEQGELDEAEGALRRAVTLLEKAFGSEHHRLALAQHNLAATLRDLGRPTQALAFAERAWRQLRTGDFQADHRAPGAFLLAQLLWREGGTAGRARALRLATAALADYETLGALHDEARSEVQRWLSAHPR